MRIAYITAGAAGMYCGSCLHDNTLARGLIARGHDVSLIPTYTPIRTDEEDVSIDRVFYGAINVYLEQTSSIFRRTPAFIDRLLRNRALLRWASNRRGSTDPKLLGALALSVLRGEQGNQKKELDQLVDWLRQEIRPEVVHLTNSMFLGMARPLKRELGVPVLCSVQGEDLFFEALVEPYRGRVLRELRGRTDDVDAFVATSRYYAGHMEALLGLARGRMRQIDLGIDVGGFEEPHEKDPAAPFEIGYLARLCPEKGLHLAVEALRRLTDRYGRDRVRLRVAGYLDSKDREYVDELFGEVRRWGLVDAVSYEGEVDRAAKVEFLRSVDLVTVPTTYHEPKGLFVLEALACGTPVVQPRHGAFPEMIERTGGGLLVDPDAPDALAEAIAELMEDPARRRALGRAGREVVLREYNDREMAEATLELYRSVIDAVPTG